MRRSVSFSRFHRLSLALVVTAGAVSSASGGWSAEAAAGAPFLAHQALYDLSLLKARGNATINVERGRILYNFSGSACEGYSSDFRQVSELDSGEGKTTLSDLRSTSWEDGAGKSYRFKIDTRLNDAEPGVVDGFAERTGDHVTVKLEALPVVKTFYAAGRLYGVPDRADPAHHRRRARRKIHSRTDGL